MKLNLSGDEGNGQTEVAAGDRVERKSLQKQFEDLQAEYKAYAPDSSTLGRSKSAELARKIRNFDVERAFGPEELVDVTVTLDAQGFPFTINDTEYMPGVHRVKASVAQVLLYMMDQNRRADQRVLQSRGKNVDLGSIGDRARAAATQMED